MSDPGTHTYDLIDSPTGDRSLSEAAAQITELLADLDGTLISAVSSLSGLTKERLEELGGVPEEAFGHTPEEIVYPPLIRTYTCPVCHNDTSNEGSYEICITCDMVWESHDGSFARPLWEHETIFLRCAETFLGHRCIRTNVFVHRHRITYRNLEWDTPR